MSNLSQTDGKHCEIGQLILKVGTQWKISDLHASPVEILVGQSFVSSSRSCEISFYRRAIFKSLSPPQASKVHCSINGLENSSSTEYSKVQHLFGIAVGLFPVGGGLFSVTVGLRKSPTPIEKSPPPIEKSPPLIKKVLLQHKKVLLWPKKFSW